MRKVSIASYMYYYLHINCGRNICNKYLFFTYDFVLQIKDYNQIYTFMIFQDGHHSISVIFFINFVQHAIGLSTVTLFTKFHVNGFTYILCKTSCFTTFWSIFARIAWTIIVGYIYTVFEYNRSSIYKYCKKTPAE